MSPRGAHHTVLIASVPALSLLGSPLCIAPAQTLANPWASSVLRGIFNKISWMSYQILSLSEARDPLEYISWSHACWAGAMIGRD